MCFGGTTYAKGRARESPIPSSRCSGGRRQLAEVALGRQRLAAPQCDGGRKTPVRIRREAQTPGGLGAIGAGEFMVGKQKHQSDWLRSNQREERVPLSLESGEFWSCQCACFRTPRNVPRYCRGKLSQRQGIAAMRAWCKNELLWRRGYYLVDSSGCSGRIELKVESEKWNSNLELS